MIRHTFAISAYKESSYLEDCIKSIINQKVKSKCLICTSTPNELIKDLAKKYNLPLYIRERKEEENSISEDWNFAVSKAETELVTVAHQDDIYLSNYTENVLKEVDNSSKPLIIFTDYAEIRNNDKTFNGLNLKIKRLMQRPFKYRFLRKSKFIRKLILSFGTPICCPSVCFSKLNLREPFFQKFMCSLDWLAWVNISNYDGDFAYINKVLMLHRIHNCSETTNLIEKNIRQNEDYYMFCKFWWKPIAKILSKLYSYSLKSNKV